MIDQWKAYTNWMCKSDCCGMHISGNPCLVLALLGKPVPPTNGSLLLLVLKEEKFPNLHSYRPQGWLTDAIVPLKLGSSRRTLSPGLRSISYTCNISTEQFWNMEPQRGIACMLVGTYIFRFRNENLMFPDIIVMEHKWWEVFSFINVQGHYFLDHRGQG